MCKSTLRFLRAVAQKASMKQALVLVTTVTLVVYMPSVEIENFNFILNL